jgi:hypothetical protein
MLPWRFIHRARRDFDILLVPEEIVGNWVGIIAEVVQEEVGFAVDKWNFQAPIKLSGLVVNRFRRLPVGQAWLGEKILNLWAKLLDEVID